MSVIPCVGLDPGNPWVPTGAEEFRGVPFGNAPGGSSGGGSINIFRKYGSDLVPRNYDVNGGIVLSVRGGSGTFTTGVISNSFFKE